MNSPNHALKGYIPPNNLSRQEIWAKFTHKSINRWAFRNVDKFASYDRVTPSESPYSLPRDEKKLGEIAFINHYGEETNVPITLSYLYADAIIVVKDGKLVYEQYFDGMRPETPHLLFSCSKPFAGVLIANLISFGLIHDEVDFLITYMPDLIPTALNDVTIRHLLDMQSGIDIHDIEDSTEIERSTGFAPPKLDENIYSIVRKLRNKKFPAGTIMDYNSLNSDVLSLLATRLTGEPASYLLNKYIFSPMGTEDEILIIKDPKGISELGGGIAITARDLAKFGAALLNDGQVNENRILPSGYIEFLKKTSEKGKWQQSWLAYSTTQAESYRAHLYFCKSEFDKDAFFAVGNFGNALYMNQKQNITIVLLCSYPTGVDIPRFNTLMEMLRAISNQLI